MVFYSIDLAIMRCYLLQRRNPLDHEIVINQGISLKKKVQQNHIPQNEQQLQNILVAEQLLHHHQRLQIQAQVI